MMMNLRFPACWIIVIAVFIKDIHPAPSIEACPKDSVELDGNCTCNMELCTQPPCAYDLEIATNGTDEPGNCCPTYSCVGCANETLIDDKCPCADGAVLDDDGVCKCADVEKKLIEGKCVCDPILCGLPTLCNERSVRVTEDNSGCCKKTKCIECPFDSYPTNVGADELEEHCSCYKCEYTCGHNEIEYLQHGTGFPGNCCHLYKCINNTNSCIDANTEYKNGENWTSGEKFCICENGVAKCFKENPKEEHKQYCRKHGRNYKHGESWREEECTNCTCHNGKESCIAHFCDVYEIKKEFVIVPKRCANATSGSWMLDRCNNCTCNNGTVACMNLCENAGSTNRTDCEPLSNCNKKCEFGYKTKNGCDLCKCNRILDVLIKQNISDKQFWEAIDHIKNPPTTTIATPVPTVPFREDLPRGYPRDSAFGDADILYKVALIILSLVTLLSIILAIIFFMKYKKHTRNNSLTVADCKYTHIDNNNHL